MGHSNISYASNIKEIFISIGEQVEITRPSIKKYSVGNKDVIKHKFRPKHQQILIKGKKIGFSDLVLWKKKEKEIFHIYVISKKKQLEQITLIESLKKMNLSIRTQGDIVYVYGKVSTEEQFLLINKIKEQKHKKLILNISLTKELRNKLFSKVYLELYRSGAQKVICRNFGIKILCSVQGLSLSSSSISHLKENFFVAFTDQLSRLDDKNFQASYKIIQIETSSADYYKLGLSSISTRLKDLIYSQNNLNDELIKIEKTNANIKILAEPQTTLILNEKANIQLGGEIPFSRKGNNQEDILEWKFYGLKISAALKNKNGKPLIQYETELTSPSEKSISGSKGKSSVYVEENKYVKLFEVGYQVDAYNSAYLPILGEIPILKSLFSSNQNVDSYKHIICYIKLEEK